MKKTIIIFALFLFGIVINAQKTSTEPKSAPKDSITAQDIAKIKYVLSVIVMQYNQQMYSDSIPVTDFIGKPYNGSFWKEKGQYYWDIYTPIPNVKYLHRKMTIEGLLEELQSKLGN
jgi:hypothetical protein